MAYLPSIAFLHFTSSSQWHRDLCLSSPIRRPLAEREIEDQERYKEQLIELQGRLITADSEHFFNLLRYPVSNSKLFGMAIGLLAKSQSYPLIPSFLQARIRSSNWGLWLTDIAHHHLAIAILFLIVGHMYKTNWGIGHGLKDILEAHKGPFTSQGYKGLYEILTTSWNAQLSLNLAMLGSLTIVVAHHMYSIPPYPYLATDYGTQLSLFTHHIWIGGFLIVGVAAHAFIFMVRDYDPTTRYNDLLDHVLRYYTAIQLQLVFAQWMQNTHALAPGVMAPGATTSTSLTLGGGDLVEVGGKVALLPIPLGTTDFLVHHIHAFTIHVIVLILLKGVLVARNSHLYRIRQILVFVFLVIDLEEGVYVNYRPGIMSS
ncbi:Photosystem I chlorophyll a apoprotein A1 [Capsicum annuum]|nr:Photosystem I chlorophyll a apoprotein A1 [Capsicum annuum]KAF3678532.1 Photosystem I chlorophyll a apoprotein A1 [Capsicum annuum]